MSQWLSPATLALVAEEIIPEIEAMGADGLEDLGRCSGCGADLLTEGCPSCQFPDDLEDSI
jgi:hypothetical protein